MSHFLSCSVLNSTEDNIHAPADLPRAQIEDSGEKKISAVTGHGQVLNSRVIPFHKQTGNLYRNSAKYYNLSILYTDNV
jgi:hypothetical protein